MLSGTQRALLKWDYNELVWFMGDGSQGEIVCLTGQLSQRCESNAVSGATKFKGENRERSLYKLKASGSA